MSVEKLKAELAQIEKDLVQCKERIKQAKRTLSLLNARKKKVEEQLGISSFMGIRPPSFMWKK